MWDAANKARGTDNDEGAGKYKNFDQLWNGVLKDDPRIPAKAKEALGALPSQEYQRLHNSGAYNKLLNGEITDRDDMQYLVREAIAKHCGIRQGSESARPGSGGLLGGHDRPLFKLRDDVGRSPKGSRTKGRGGSEGFTLFR